MATHPSVEANMKADTKRVSDGRVSEMQRRSELPVEAYCAEDLLFRTEPNVVPIAVIPVSVPRRRKLRRIITREEGRALEMIGHAVDYLNDCYLYEGDEKEIINIGGPTMKALGILVSARAQILQSLPLQESRTVRLWNTLFHHSSHHTSQRTSERASERTPHHGYGGKSQPSGVVPLSSSR